MLISHRSRVWNGFLLAALLLSLLSTVVAASPARASTAPSEHDDELSTPLAIEVTMTELPAIGKTAAVTIVVSSTERAAGIRVDIVGSEGLRIDDERGFVIDLAAGESRTLRTSVTPEAAGNHTVAANVSLDFGGGTVWGDSDAVYFNSGDGTASEGFTYAGDPLAGAGVPGPGNTMDFESEAFPDGSMPAVAIDEDVMLPVDTGEPGGQDDGGREGDIAAAAGMLKIRGNTGMSHRNGLWKPQMLLVELLASNGVTITWTYSNIYGDFVFNVNNPGTFRIRVWANYVHSSMTIGAIRVVGNGLQTLNKFSRAGWHYFIPTMGPFPNGEINVGAWIPDPNWSGSRAWWIYQDLIDAWLYTRNQTPQGVPADSRQPDGVTVEWEPGSTVGTFYSNSRIHLEDVDANSGHTVLHEYGHAVMDNVYSSFPFNDCPSPHFIQRVGGKNCAWTEGWASFLAIAVKWDPVYTWGCALPCTPASVNFEERYTPTFPVPWDEGELVEGNVTASLWDFVDAYTDGFDKTNSAITPFWKIWDVVYNHDHNTFFEFWIHWRGNVNFINSLATLYQNTIDYGWFANCPDYLYEDDDNFLEIPINAFPNDPPYQRAFCTDNDVDWYKFPAVAGDTYTIETSNLGVAQNGSIADTTLTLYRQDPHTLTQLAYDDNGGSQDLSSRIVHTATTGGEFLVAVRHKDNRGDRNYSYSIDFTLASSNVAPSVTAPTHQLFAGGMLGNPEADVYTVDVRASWTASDPDDGIAFQSLQGQVDDAGYVALEPSLAGTAQSHNVPLTIGTANQLQVSATDSFGASSGYATGESFELLGAQETGFTYEGLWTTHDATGAWGGSYMSTDGSPSPSIAAVPSVTDGATATFNVTGASVALVGMTAPDGGRAEIYIDGDLQGMADFYSVKPMSRQVVFAVNDLSAGAHHTLEVRWIPYSNEWSSGYQLYLDGIIALN